MSYAGMCVPLHTATVDTSATPVDGHTSPVRPPRHTGCAVL